MPRTSLLHAGISSILSPQRSYVCCMNVCEFIYATIVTLLLSTIYGSYNLLRSQAAMITETQELSCNIDVPLKAERCSLFFLQLWYTEYAHTRADCWKLTGCKQLYMNFEITIIWQVWCLYYLSYLQYKCWRKYLNECDLFSIHTYPNVRSSLENYAVLYYSRNNPAKTYFLAPMKMSVYRCRHIYMKHAYVLIY